MEFRRLRRPLFAVGGRCAALVLSFAAAALGFAGTAQAQRPGERPDLTQDQAAPAKAEEKVVEVGRWIPNVEAGIALTQSAYSDNWVGGDRGSITWTFNSNSSLENQLAAKVNWLSTLKLAYGQTHQQVVGTDGGRSWDRPDKSTDLIDLESIFRFTLNQWADPYVSGRFVSQFQDLSDPEGRDLWINPMTFRESVGLAKPWVDEENRWLTTRLGFTFRQNVRSQFLNPFPDETTARSSTNDGGLEMVNDLRMKILEDRVTWTSRLGIYQPFFWSSKSDLEDLDAAQLEAAGLDADVADFTTMVDADWENIFSTQITKIISVNLYVRWLYDKYDNSVKPLFDDSDELANPGDVGSAVRKAGQFKQTLGIGLTYRFL